MHSDEVQRCRASLFCYIWSRAYVMWWRKCRPNRPWLNSDVSSAPLVWAPQSSWGQGSGVNYFSIEVPALQSSLHTLSPQLHFILHTTHYFTTLHYLFPHYTILCVTTLHSTLPHYTLLFHTSLYTKLILTTLHSTLSWIQLLYRTQFYFTFLHFTHNTLLYLITLYFTTQQTTLS